MQICVANTFMVKFNGDYKLNNSVLTYPLNDKRLALIFIFYCSMINTISNNSCLNKQNLVKKHNINTADLSLLLCQFYKMFKKI